VAKKRGERKVFGHVIGNHVVGRTVEDDDGAIGHALTKGHDVVVDMARTRLDGVLREKAAGAIVLVERGGEMLGSV